MTIATNSTITSLRDFFILISSLPPLDRRYTIIVLSPLLYSHPNLSLVSTRSMNLNHQKYDLCRGAIKYCADLGLDSYQEHTASIWGKKIVTVTPSSISPIIKDCYGCGERIHLGAHSLFI